MIKKLVKLTLILVVFSMLPLVAKAATLYFVPQSQTLYQEETFISEIRINTEGEAINVCAISLDFPKDQLEIIDVIKGGSILSLWPEEPFYSNKEGGFSFVGGVPEGFIGEGKLISLVFRVIDDDFSNGSSQVKFKENSKVLLNDGQGTKASLIFLEANYEIIEKPANLPEISSSTHPDQNKWYKLDTLHFHWQLIEGAQYSYLLSKDSSVSPDEIPDKPEGELLWIGDMEYPNLEDGIYYFYLRQKLPGEDWSKKLTFRTMVDATTPEEFIAEIGQDSSMWDGKYFLSFYTTDDASGLDYFEITEGKEDPQRVTSPYLLKDQNLRSKITVKAIDKAGNEKVFEIIPPSKIGWKDIMPWIIVSVVIGTAIWWLVWWLTRRILTAKKNQTPKL